ncbi:MAG: branched-chain alpha-keto acid dehydrogenase subunit E2, partial [Paracoccaceae bacterium]
MTIITGTGRSTCGTEVNFRIGVVSSQIVVSELNPETNRYEERASFDPVLDEVPEGYSAARRQAGARYRVTLAE